MKKIVALVIVLSSVVFFEHGDACTTFSLPGTPEKYVANNLDWFVGHGIVMTNPRHLEKTAMLIKSAAPALKWISKYGSLTFNQVGREFPYGGMNEKGLVIEVMWLQNTNPPALNGQKPAVNEVQWLQYMLDSAATVDEMITLVQTIQLQKIFAPIHYMACDASKCAIFEYINRQLVIHTGAQLPYPLLTNDTYVDSVSFLKQHAGFGGNRPIPEDSESLSRFVRAASTLVNAKEPQSLELAFKVLDIIKSVPQKRGDDVTVWNLVYSPVKGEAYFRSPTVRDIKRVSFMGLNFDCRQPPKGMDIHAKLSGDVTNAMKDVTKQVNDTLVNMSDFLPENLRAALAAYPQSMRCVD